MESQESPVKMKAIQVTDIEMQRRMNQYESMLDMEQVMFFCQTLEVIKLLKKTDFLKILQEF